MVVKYGLIVYCTILLWQAGRKFSSLLSTLHLHFLKGTSGVKQDIADWAELPDSWQE